MFEKEAEEYRKDLKSKFFLSEPQLDLACQGFKDGLRKANEWHYVKDGIFPTHSNRVLVFTDEGVGFGIFGLDNKKWYTYDTGFDVIAWKEIVLPELKESELPTL